MNNNSNSNNNNNNNNRNIYILYKLIFNNKYISTLIFKIIKRINKQICESHIPNSTIKERYNYYEIPFKWIIKNEKYNLLYEKIKYSNYKLNNHDIYQEPIIKFLKYWNSNNNNNNQELQMEILNKFYKNNFKLIYQILDNYGILQLSIESQCNQFLKLVLNENSVDNNNLTNIQKIELISFSLKTGNLEIIKIILNKFNIFQILNEIKIKNSSSSISSSSNQYYNNNNNNNNYIILIIYNSILTENRNNILEYLISLQEIENEKNEDSSNTIILIPPPSIPPSSNNKDNYYYYLPYSMDHKIYFFNLFKLNNNNFNLLKNQVSTFYKIELLIKLVEYCCKYLIDDDGKFESHTPNTSNFTINSIDEFISIFKLILEFTPTIYNEKLKICNLILENLNKLLNYNENDKEECIEEDEEESDQDEKEVQPNNNSSSSNSGFYSKLLSFINYNNSNNNNSNNSHKIKFKNFNLKREIKRIFIFSYLKYVGTRMNLKFNSNSFVSKELLVLLILNFICQYNEIKLIEYEFYNDNHQNNLFNEINNIGITHNFKSFYTYLIIISLKYANSNIIKSIPKLMKLSILKFNEKISGGGGYLLLNRFNNNQNIQLFKIDGTINFNQQIQFFKEICKIVETENIEIIELILNQILCGISINNEEEEEEEEEEEDKLNEIAQLLIIFKSRLNDETTTNNNFKITSLILKSNLNFTLKIIKYYFKNYNQLFEWNDKEFGKLIISLGDLNLIDFIYKNKIGNLDSNNSIEYCKNKQVAMFLIDKLGFKFNGSFIEIVKLNDWNSFYLFYYLYNIILLKDNNSNTITGQTTNKSYRHGKYIENLLILNNQKVHPILKKQLYDINEIISKNSYYDLKRFLIDYNLSSDDDDKKSNFNMVLNNQSIKLLNNFDSKIKKVLIQK